MNHTTLVLFNTDRLRLLLYPDTDMSLICFSVVNRLSFKNAEKWVDEIKHHCPNVPFLLVGTQIFFREDENTLDKPISFEEGKFLAKKLKAVKYVEYLAFNQKRVKNVFDESILAALKIHQQSEQKKIVINFIYKTKENSFYNFIFI